MFLEDAKKVMRKEGIAFTEVETLKGSCKAKGLSVGEGSVRPTIYEKSISEMCESDFLDFIKSALENVPTLDTSIARDKDFIFEHAVTCIRHQTDDDVSVKWDAYGDLEEYVRINLGSDVAGNDVSFVATKELLKAADIDEDELKMAARKNLKDTVVIKGMTEIIREMMGNEETALPDMNEVMYVATTESKTNGAAVMVLKDVLQEFCESHGLDSIYIIPSSLHEVIITSTRMPIVDVDRMIREVNETEVDPWERLSDHVYIFAAA